MSKNTSHYNWQNWFSQTNNNIKKKKQLNEMRQHWFDLILPAIAEAAKAKNTNFKNFFDKGQNRLVIPYDQAKMKKLGLLIGICQSLIQAETLKQSNVYTEKMYQKYSGNATLDYHTLSNDENLEVLNKMPERFFEDNKTRAYGRRFLEGPKIIDMFINIRENVVQQKFIPAAGAAPQIKDVTLYEPIIQFTISSPFSDKMSQEEVDKIQDEQGKNRLERKYSFTVGQTLQKYKQKELFDWWQNNQSKFTQDKETIEGAKEYSEKNKNNRYEEASRLTTYFNQTDENAKNDYSIVISRSPVDVLRMSDFKGFKSCHAQPEDYGDSSYFYCTLAEARNQGAIAYLVKTDDIETVDLNAPEIFADPQRGIKGIYPLQRTRLRRIIDNNTNVDFMAMETRTYGPERKVSFLDTVKSWIVGKTAKMLLNDPTVEKAEDGRYYIPEGDSMAMLGGSYTDSGVRDLGRDLTNTFRMAVNKLVTKDTEDYSFLEDQIENFEQQAVTRDSIEWQGDEDEYEIQNECEEAEQEMESTKNYFAGRANYAYFDYSIDCNQRTLEQINAEISFGGHISKSDTPQISIDFVKTQEFFSKTDQKEMLEAKIAEAFTNMIRAEGNIFNSSDIKAELRLFTGPNLEFNFYISESFSGTYDANQMATVGLRTLNNIDFDTDILELVIQQCMNLGLVAPPVVKQQNVQDTIQRFADEAASEGNHFKWSDDSNEDRGEDIFTLVVDPARIQNNSNLPIIAKIPIPYVNDPPMEEEQNEYTLDKIVKRIRDNGSAIASLINRNLETKFSENKSIGKPFGREAEEEAKIHRTRSLNVTPFNDVFEIQVFAHYEDVEAAKIKGSDFLNVRMKFNIKIDSGLQSEQEIVNVLNFMDRVGAGEGYEQLLDLATDMFKEHFNKVDPMFSYYFQEEERKLIGGVNRAASQPVKTSTIPKPPSIDISRSPLFSGIPVTQGQHMNENNKKKLVINERFKRLLRNMKK